MMVCTHAAVGAGVGAAARQTGSALAAGVVSHLLCDLLPHRDYDIKVEAPLALTMFAYLAWRHGIRSAQFAGAIGAVLPDVENALALFGAFPQSRTLFPTHNETAPWFLGHGRKLKSPATQFLLAGLALWWAARGQNA